MLNLINNDWLLRRGLAFCGWWCSMNCALQVRLSRSPTVRRCTRTSPTPATSPTGVTTTTVACTALKKLNPLWFYWDRLLFGQQTCTTSSSRRPSATSSTSHVRRGYARGSWWGGSLSWWGRGRSLRTVSIIATLKREQRKSHIFWLVLPHSCSWCNSWWD